MVRGGVQYYVAPDGRGTVDDVSRKLRDGCPSYYNESDYQFYQAVESLERAAGSCDAEERDRLAKEALELLSRVPETADLLSVCQRFEDIRYGWAENVMCGRGVLRLHRGSMVSVWRDVVEVHAREVGAMTELHRCMWKVATIVGEVGGFLSVGARIGNGHRSWKRVGVCCWLMGRLCDVVTGSTRPWWSCL
jgi:hypothetical protein